MNYETFLEEKKRIAKLSVREQKDFYEGILETEQQESGIRLQAYLGYAAIFIMKAISVKPEKFWSPLH